MSRFRLTSPEDQRRGAGPGGRTDRKPPPKIPPLLPTARTSRTSPDRHMRPPPSAPVCPTWFPHRLPGRFTPARRTRQPPSPASRSPPASPLSPPDTRSRPRSRPVDAQLGLMPVLPCLLRPVSWLTSGHVQATPSEPVPSLCPASQLRLGNSKGSRASKTPDHGQQARWVIPALVPDMCSRIRSRPVGRTPNPATARRTVIHQHTRRQERGTQVSRRAGHHRSGSG